jgi:diguanylate cyclase (GGDEF)-like protein
MSETAAKSCAAPSAGEPDLQEMRRRIALLEQEKSDLEVALDTAVEHGDAIEADLIDLNRRLRTEIKERIQAEQKLNMLVTAVTQQRQDLEILVKTITEHSDDIDLEWLERYNQAEELSRIDSLTRIPNRRGFDAAIEREWRRCARQRRSVSVLMCDVDWFKGYNDHYGHQAGDECLAVVGHEVESVCRRPSDVPARYGGEEFAVLLPETGLEGALIVAQDLCAALKRRAVPHASSPLGRVSLSVGVASRISSPDASPWDLVSEADRRLYAAKRMGRDAVVHIDAGHDI